MILKDVLYFMKYSHQYHIHTEQSRQLNTGISLKPISPPTPTATHNHFLGSSTLEVVSSTIVQNYGNERPFSSGSVIVLVDTELRAGGAWTDMT